MQTQKMNNSMLLIRFACAVGVIFLICNANNAIAQIYVQHQAPPFVEAEKPITLEFRVSGINISNIQEVYIYFRYRGENSYRQQQAFVTDNIIASEITFSEFPSTVAEYYLSIEFIDGNTYTWPEYNAEAEPATVEIVPQDTRNENVFDSITGEIQYTILSPLPDEQLRPEDFFLGITLFYEHAIAETDSFLIFLDGRDITENAEISPYLITYVPSEDLSPGIHQLELLYNSPESIQIDVAAWDFRIISADLPIQVTAPVTNSPRFINSGQYQAVARSQSYANNNTGLFRNNFRISGGEGNFNYSVNAMLTSQEDPRLQPQNRFSAHIRSGNWLLLEAGHIYPMLNPYLIAGRRMYGFHSSIKMLSEKLQLQFLYGELNRNIAPLYGDIVREEIVMGQNNQGEDILAASYLLQSQRRGAGTYTRDFMGARIGFGSGRNFGMSFSTIKIEDAIQSIDAIRSYNELPPDLLMNLEDNHRDELENNPGLLEIRTNDPSPQGNFAFATDLKVNMDNDRIQFHSDIAASLVNNDISAGILDKDRADYLGFDLDDNIGSLLDQLSWLIVINENMNALPFKIEEDRAEVFLPKGIFATQSRLNLNYFNHNASVQYQWVGPEFRSLANAGQRRDIAGFTVSDRFRVLSNTIYLTLGHENLNDNVIGNRDATTHSVAYRADLGWYPRSVHLPRIRIATRRRTRNNGFQRFNPFLPDHLIPSSVRNVKKLDDDIVVLPSPRNNITMQYTTSVTQSFVLFDFSHDAGFNFTHMITDDRVFEYGDFKSNIFSVDLVSSFPSMPVRTSLGMNLNRTKSLGGLNKLDIYGLNMGIYWVLMGGRIQLNSDLAMTFDQLKSVPLASQIHEDFTGPTSEEIYWLYYVPDLESFEETSTVSYIFGGAMKIKIHEQHSVNFRVNYTHLSDRRKVFNIPNNHLAEIRYVFDLW